MDFDHPIGKLWPGYVPPTWRPCPKSGVDCFSGGTAAGAWLESIARLIAMVGDEGAVSTQAAGLRARGRTYPHPYLTSWDQAPRNRVRGGLVPLTDDLRALVEGLSGTKHGNSLLGFDAYRIAHKLAEVAGMPDRWDWCKVCNGTGTHPDDIAASESWEPTHPPTGDGYQLWETTSEGSPESPVFASLDELCSWCADNATTFANYRASAAKWREMLDTNLVMHVEGNVAFM
jgi:hypothetical protein